MPGRAEVRRVWHQGKALRRTSACLLSPLCDDARAAPDVPSTSAAAKSAQPAGAALAERALAQPRRGSCRRGARVSPLVEVSTLLAIILLLPPGARILAKPSLTITCVRTRAGGLGAIRP